MSIEYDFLTLMYHEVEIRPFLGYSTDGYMTPTHAATPLKYKVRIAGKGLALRQRTGSEDDSVIYDIWIGERWDPQLGDWVDASFDDFTTRDLITLPPGGEWMDQTPEIFAVSKRTDDHGLHHTKIQCGWMYHRQTAS